MAKAKAKERVTSDNAVSRLKDEPPRLIAVASKLYLQISSAGTKSWIYRYHYESGGKRRERRAGLGAWPKVDFETALKKASDWRAIHRTGRDPFEHFQERASSKEAVNTFEKVARAWHRTNAPSWKNEKHRAQNLSTLETYVFPLIGQIDVAEIKKGDVIKVMEQPVKTKEGEDLFWVALKETSRRTLNRIAQVIEYASAREMRAEDLQNPATIFKIKGGLPKVDRKVEHHPALPWKAIPELYWKLRDIEGVGACALRWKILTAVRTNAVIGARWDQMTAANEAWVIPFLNTKMKRADHRIPVTDGMHQLIEDLCHFRHAEDEGWMFPGARIGQPISNMAMIEVLRGMKVPAVPHGMRSSFRNWVTDTHAASRFEAEIQLEHKLPPVEGAYATGDAFEGRVKLMADWSNFVTSFDPDALSNGTIVRPVSECL